MSKLDLIRAGHTEVADGQCGLCDVPWPCDTGVVLAALAESGSGRSSTVPSSEIRDVDDLRGMLPDEILAVIRAAEARAEARIDALTAEVERLRGWQSGQTHYVGCWREHRSCALATLDFEGARRERAEMALQGMADRLARVIAVLLDNSEGTSEDGQPCWCGVDPVYSAHADWCVSARKIVSEHNSAATV